jgi:glycosyltransferase involved in cell wall biosynthesis
MNGKLIISGCFTQAHVVGLSDAFIQNGDSIIAIGTDYRNCISNPDKIKFIDFRKQYEPKRSFLQKTADLPGYYVKMIIAALRSPQKTVLNLFSGRPIIEGILLHGILKLSGKKVFLIVHNILPHNKETFFNKFLHFIIYRITTDKFIVHAPHFKQRLTKEFGVKSENIVYAPMGVYKMVSTSDVTRETARNMLHIPPERFVILSFGAQLPYKGTHLLLNAISAIVDKDKFFVLICGKPHNNYDKFLQTIINDKGLQVLVNTSFGFIPENEIQHYFKAADVVVLPYLEDSQSGVLFTAFSFGRPVIASDIGSFADFIEPGKTGELFPTGDPDSLMKMLVKLRENKLDYDEKYIANEMNEKYSWEKCAEAISILYKSN